MDAAVTALAGQLRVRGCGCVPLPPALARAARAVLQRSGGALRDAELQRWLQAHPHADTESVAGLRVLPNGRASFFYRRHAGLAPVSEAATGLLAALDPAWDECARAGLRVLERLGWEVPLEQGPRPTLTSLAVQSYPSVGGGVDEHVDGCALTLVVMRAGDARLHLRDPVTHVPLVPRGDLACGVGVPPPGGGGGGGSGDGGGGGSGGDALSGGDADGGGALWLVAFRSHLLGVWGGPELSGVSHAVAAGGGDDSCGRGSGGGHRAAAAAATVVASPSAALTFASPSSLRTTLVLRLYPPRDFAIVPRAGRAGPPAAATTVADALAAFRGAFSSVNQQAPPHAPPQGPPQAPAVALIRVSSSSSSSHGAAPHGDDLGSSDSSPPAGSSAAGAAGSALAASAAASASVGASPSAKRQRMSADQQVAAASLAAASIPRVEPAPDEPPRLSLTIRDADGSDVVFRVSPTVSLGKVFFSYCARRGVRLESLKFLYDGDALSPTYTPESIGLENGGVISAIPALQGD